MGSLIAENDKDDKDEKDEKNKKKKQDEQTRHKQQEQKQKKAKPTKTKSSSGGHQDKALRKTQKTAEQKLDDKKVIDNQCKKIYKQGRQDGLKRRGQGMARSPTQAVESLEQ